MTPATPQRPLLELLANSNVVVALVTVVGSGLLGSWVAGRIQDRNRQRELASLAYKEFQAAQLATVKDAFELLGSYFSASQDLLYIAKPEFRPGNYAGAERVRIEQQIAQIRQSYNTADEQWRRRKESLGFLIAYYTRGRPRSTTKWKSVEDAAESFNQCAFRYYLQQSAGQESGEAAPCASDEQGFRNRVAEFTGELDAARQDLWERWGVLSK